MKRNTFFIGLRPGGGQEANDSEVFATSKYLYEARSTSPMHAPSEAILHTGRNGQAILLLRNSICIPQSSSGRQDEKGEGPPLCLKVLVLTVCSIKREKCCEAVALGLVTAF